MIEFGSPVSLFQFLVNWVKPAYFLLLFMAGTWVTRLMVVILRNLFFPFLIGAGSFTGAARKHLTKGYKQEGK